MLFIAIIHIFVYTYICLFVPYKKVLKIFMHTMGLFTPQTGSAVLTMCRDRFIVECTFNRVKKLVKMCEIDINP